MEIILDPNKITRGVYCDGELAKVVFNNKEIYVTSADSFGDKSYKLEYIKGVYYTPTAYQRYCDYIQKRKIELFKSYKKECKNINEFELLSKAIKQRNQNIKPKFRDILVCFKTYKPAN